MGATAELTPMPTRTLSKSEIESRSAFRHQLRLFERAGEDAARKYGITFPQYLVLLHAKGMPGRAWALVGELAEKMLLEHHSVVGLVSRCETAGLVKRKRSAEDARQVEVHLTAKGDRTVNSIAVAQSNEMKALSTFIASAVKRGR
jgi:DNA-binding MarR family transcriptional regulator